MKYALYLFALLAVSPAFAEGWYVDIGYGSAGAEHEDWEGSDKYGRLAIGYQYPDDILIEAGALDLGETQDGLITASSDGVYAAMKGIVRGERADYFMRAGVLKWQGEVCAGAACLREKDIDGFVGIGVAFDAGPGALNVELHYVPMDEVNVTMFGVSYSILFQR